MLSVNNDYIIISELILLLSDFYDIIGCFITPCLRGTYYVNRRLLHIGCNKRRQSFTF